MKRRGKQSRGYVPGDFLGNFLRASHFGAAKPFIDDQPPFNKTPDLIRQFVISQCCDLTRPPRQVRFYTCRDLFQLAVEGLNWRGSERQVRNICRHLGIKLLEASRGRTPGAKNRKF